MTEAEIAALVADVLQALPSEISTQAACSQTGGAGEVPLETSARHVHLSQEALETLFGAGFALTKKRDLSQPGEFLTEQRLKLVTSKGTIDGVAVLGPVRKAVQVELSFTDARVLGLNPPVNLSGNLSGASDVLLVGPKGILEAKSSVIVAQNHIHMTPDDAVQFGVNDGDIVAVRTQTARPVTFERVFIRVNQNFQLAMHIDFDEANACGYQTDAMGYLCKIGNQTAPQAAIVEEQPKALPDKLITETRARELAKTDHAILLQSGTVLTPSARDIFRAAKTNVRIQKGDKYEAL